MKKLLKKSFLSALSLVISIASLTSCGNSDQASVHYAAVKLVDSDMWSIVDTETGEIIHKEEFKSQPSVIMNDRFCVKNERGLYDYFTVDNVTTPINCESYQCATSFNENGIALAVLRGKGISVINSNCDIIANLDNSIISAGNFVNGYAVVSTDDNKYGYINEKGESIIKPSYDKALKFSDDGLAIVGKEIDDETTEYFIIDTAGKELFSFSSDEYKDFGSFINGYLPVQREDNEVILLDKTGNKFISIGKWNDYVPFWLGFNDGTIVFREGDAHGLKNDKEEVVIRAKYNELKPFAKGKSGLYLAKKQEKYGVIDKDDRIIIPFDYKVLGCMDNGILFAGEDKSFNFVNTDLKDVGQNNYTNMSLMTGSSIRSHYFNAENEASKIISNISDSTFFKTRKGMVLRDFKEKLSGNKYIDTDESTLEYYSYPFAYLYGFDENLSSERYEDIYGYRIPTSTEYNYDANLSIVCVTDGSFAEFQPGSEEALAEAFDTQIQIAGFKPVDGSPNWFKNRNMSVALGYNKGNVMIMCAYDSLYEPEVERNSRQDPLNADIQVDYIDTFGLEQNEDSAALTADTLEKILAM